MPTLPPKPATTIRWEKAQYTISESDRKVEMCILVVGTSQVKATVVPQDLTATEKGTRLLISSVTLATMPFSLQITRRRYLMYNYDDHPKTSGKSVCPFQLLMTN